jgi:putative membrane protein
MRHGRRARLAGLLLGLALLAAILVSVDPSGAARDVAAAGWVVAWVAFYRFLPIAIDAAGWRALLPSAVRVGFPALVCFRWIGESVNTLLPVVQIGGDVARARLLAATNQRPAETGASVVADFTVGLAVQLVFTLFGVGALVAVVGVDGNSAAWLFGVGVAAVGVIGLYIAQRRGALAAIPRRLMRWAPVARLADVAAGAAAVDESLRGLYRQRAAVLGCAGWRLAGWLVRVGETWLILSAFGTSTGLLAALAIESLSNAARSAAFPIPAAIGAQEGGVVAVAVLVGVGPETALALALVKRLREIAVGVPGLCAWAIIERRSRRGGET